MYLALLCGVLLLLRWDDDEYSQLDILSNILQSSVANFCFSLLSISLEDAFYSSGRSRLLREILIAFLQMFVGKLIYRNQVEHHFVFHRIEGSKSFLVLYLMIKSLKGCALVSE